MPKRKTDPAPSAPLASPASVKIRVMTEEGDPVTYTVPLTGEDQTIEVALKTAGVSADKCDVTVAGKTVKKTDKAKPGKPVTVTPRPRGS